MATRGGDRCLLPDPPTVECSHPHGALSWIPSALGSYETHPVFRPRCAELGGTGHARMFLAVRVVEQEELNFDDEPVVVASPCRFEPDESGEVSFMELIVADDAVGAWVIGCFQQATQHYEGWMRATLIVEA